MATMETNARLELVVASSDSGDSLAAIVGAGELQIQAVVEGVSAPPPQELLQLFEQALAGPDVVEAPTAPALEPDDASNGEGEVGGPQSTPRCRGQQKKQNKRLLDPSSWNRIWVDAKKSWRRRR